MVEEDPTIVLSLPKKFTVRRSGWWRGQLESGLNTSSLLRKQDNKMCCLGFLAQAAGCSDEELLEMSSPVELARQKKILLTGLVHYDREDGIYDNSLTCKNIIATNDEERLPLGVDTREEELAKLFKKLGVEVEFVE